MNLHQFTVDVKGTLLDAAYAINKNHSRCALVVNSKKVEGIISEGDILRALLRGAEMYAPMRTYVHHGFFFLNERNMEEALKIIRLRGVTLIPILNNDMELKEVITLKSLLSQVKLIGQGSDD